MESLPPGGWTARVTFLPQAVDQVVIPAIHAREAATPPAVSHWEKSIILSPPINLLHTVGDSPTATTIRGMLNRRVTFRSAIATDQGHCGRSLAPTTGLIPPSIGDLIPCRTLAITASIGATPTNTAVGGMATISRSADFTPTRGDRQGIKGPHGKFH